MAETTTCAIIGGSPAGRVLGHLLARAGVQVTLLEKHGDFLRDFRGDTVHPTTLRLLDELGLWERFSALHYSEVHKAKFESNGRSVTYVDFGRLRQPHPFVAMVPQWDLLNLLADAAQAEPSFTLRMNTEATGLLREGDRFTGVRYAGRKFAEHGDAVEADRQARRIDNDYDRSQVTGYGQTEAARDADAAVADVEAWRDEAARNVAEQRARFTTPNDTASQIAAQRSWERSRAQLQAASNAGQAAAIAHNLLANASGAELVTLAGEVQP